MSIKKKNIYGSGGGGGSSTEIRNPVIDPNNLQSNATAKIIDIIAHGPIQGLVDGDKSIYINNVQLQADGGDYNFDGITTSFKTGTAGQTAIDGFTSSENEVAVSVEIPYGSPVVKTITDSNVDDVRVQIAIPALFNANPNNGDRLKTTVQMNIYVNDLFVATVTKNGKCTSEYRFSKRITNLSQYGSAPWDIKIQKLTPDGDNEVLRNDIYWASYTEIINHKFTWPNISLCGFIADAQQFGQQLPSRGYLVDGGIVQIPSNYNPTTRVYTGVWDGSFTTGFTDNPAWILYAMLSNTKYGEGIASDYIDLSSLYTISQYNDVMVDDGNGGTEPRFTFNWCIEQRKEAYDVITSIASSMRAKVYYGSDKVYIIQDRDSDPIKLATNSNVNDGLFDYQTTSSSDDIYTSVNVTWNDPDNLYMPAIESVDASPENIQTYGRKTLDITAIGCTSRGQAHRQGLWALESSLNQTEMVQFTAGWEFCDVFPGDIIKVMDNHYANTQYGGRAVSGSSASIELDREITFDGVSTYVISVELSGGSVDNDVEITNGAGTTSSITVATPFSGQVLPHAEWIVASTSTVEPRLFMVMSNEEVAPNEFKITGLYHDPNKYARIENGEQFDTPVFTLAPAPGEVPAPTDLEIEEREYEDYVDSLTSNLKFKIFMSWSPPSDPRRILQYNVQSRNVSGGWLNEGNTAENYYEIKPITAGDYYFRVRSEALTGHSTWLESEKFTATNAPSGTSDITGLSTVNGPTSASFSGKDCEFIWSYTKERGFKDYKVQITKTDDTVLRTRYVNDTSFIYRYTDNEEDNSGSPLRQFKIKVWTRNQFNNLSKNGVALTVSNPAPDMSSTTPTVTSKPTYLKVEWTPNSDTDMAYYNIYCDTSNPPTTLVGSTIHPDVYFEVLGLTYGPTYYVQIEPYDEFGVGTKSVIPIGKTTLQIPSVDVDVELQNSLTISTDIPSGSYTGTLTDLYDGIIDSDGITSTAPSGHYFQYSYGISDYFDRVGIWSANGNPTVYFGLSDDDGSTWEYFAGYANGELVSYGSNEANAIANAWNLSSGLNVALLPNNKWGNTFRIYFTNDSSIQIYEFVPSRIIIAELAAIESLSAISANIGTIVAGTMQSSNYSTDTGMLIDLDNDTIKMGGSDGAALEYTGDDTLTLNGNLDIAEGGQIAVGNDNILMRSTTDTNDLIVAGDGGPADTDYTRITNRGVDCFYRTGSNKHVLYKSLNRIETGVVSNGGTVTIPGYFFDGPPKVSITPHKMTCYNKSYPLQSQVLDINAYNVIETSPDSRRYKFTAKAQLILGPGSYTTNVNKYNHNWAPNSNPGSGPVSFGTVYSGNQAITNPNTRRIVANIKTRAFAVRAQTGDLNSSRYQPVGIYIRLDYYAGGSWIIGPSIYEKRMSNGWVSNSLDTGTSSINITSIRAVIKWVQRYEEAFYAFDPFVVNIVPEAADIANHSGSYGEIALLSYSSDIASTTILANGSVNWMAIGS